MMLPCCLLATVTAIKSADLRLSAHQAYADWLVLQQSVTQQLERLQAGLSREVLLCPSHSQHDPDDPATRPDRSTAAFMEGPYLDWLHSVVRASGWLTTGEHSSSLLTLQDSLLHDAAAELAQHLPHEAAVRLEKTLIDWLDAFDGRLVPPAQEDATLAKASICDRLWPALGVLLLAAYAELRRSPTQLRHVERPPPSFCDNDGEPWAAEDYVVRPSEGERLNRRLHEDTLRHLRLVMESFGFVVLHDVLPADLAESLRAELLETRSTHLNATTLQPEGRSHPLLHPLEPKVESALRWMGVLNPTASQVEAPAADARPAQLRRVTSGVDSISSSESADAPGFFGQILPSAGAITELAALLVYRGATAQVPHTDTFNLGDLDVKVTTAFTVLQNTREEMGALQLVPRSHLCPLSEPVDEAEFAAKKVTLALPRGATVLMNSRTLHRSGRHVDGADRAVFYFSWAEPARGPRKYLPIGSTYALRPDLWGSMALPLSFEEPTGAARASTDASPEGQEGRYNAGAGVAMMSTLPRTHAEGGLLPADQHSSGGEPDNPRADSDAATSRDRDPHQAAVTGASCRSARPGTPSAWGLADLFMVRVREAALSTFLTREHASN